MKFIVAAPHSFCTSKSERHCDRVAAEAAREIQRYDIGKNIKSFLLSDEIRTLTHDYNRANTDTSAWRSDLRKNICAINPDFIFEIHSFPGRHKLYRENWPGADLVIYKSDINAEYVEYFAGRIRSLVGAEYNVQVVVPWHPVAITDDIAGIRKSNLQYSRMMHSLIEFNEDMPIERVHILAHAVYDSVIDLIESRYGIGPIVQMQRGGAEDIGDGFDPSETHPASINLYERTMGGLSCIPIEALIGVFAIVTIMGCILLGMSYVAAREFVIIAGGSHVGDPTSGFGSWHNISLG